MPDPVAPHAAAYSRLWRGVSAALITASIINAPLILAAVVLATDPPITPPLLLYLVGLYAMLPAVSAAVIQRALAAHVRLDGGQLLVQRRDLQLEIPCNAIGRIAPWIVPLP